MKRTSLSALVVLVLATLPAWADDSAGGRSACRARPSVVAVYCGDKLMGSATVVGDGLALTCRHVLRNRRSLRVAFLHGGEAPCEIAYEDEDLDLALLRLPTTGVRVLRVASTSPEVGEPVWAVGHPQGYLFSILSGVVSADGREVEMPGGPTLTGVLQTDALIEPGCSGGPLLNAAGEVAGLVIAISRDARCVSFALPAPALRRFVDRHQRKGMYTARSPYQPSRIGSCRILPAGGPRP
jgi:S1-C subfamily serine protease